jgi:hypothetical protein
VKDNGNCISLFEIPVNVIGKLNQVRFDVLMTVSMKRAVIWDISLCRLVDID